MRPRGLGAQLLDLLFPPRCQVCRSFSGDPLCETCRTEALFIDESRCPCCGGLLRASPPESLPGGLCEDCREGRWISGARSVGLHTGPLRSAMIAYKFHGRTRLAPTFAELLASIAVRECAGPHAGLPLDRCHALLPVPLHPKRRAWRGFDQAEMLCRALSEPLKLPVWDDALMRIRETQPQTQVPGPLRRSNVSGAFEVRKSWRLKGRSLILIDDVMTTGSTLEECARVLKYAGVAAVYALTVTRAVPRWHPVMQQDHHALGPGGYADA